MGGRVADRGVVLSMAAKATSRPKGRPRALETPVETAWDWTQSQIFPPAALDRVKEAAVSRPDPDIQRKSRMRESRTSGSVRGASGDRRPYSTAEVIHNALILKTSFSVRL